MPASTLPASLVAALWGWPGVVLILLGAWHLAERRYHWPPILPGRVKAAAAAVTIALVVITAWHGVSLPADDAALGAQLEGRRMVAPRPPSPRERAAAEERARLLRRDLVYEEER